MRARQSLHRSNTETTTGPATLTSTDVANKYIAALDKRRPSALQPILAKNVVSIDWAYGSGPPFRSAKTLGRVWARVFASSGDAHFRGSLRSAGPSGRRHLAVARLHQPLTYEPFTMNGLSILTIKNGKIICETYYWDVPGRNPGIAAATGRKFATMLSAHQAGWRSHRRARIVSSGVASPGVDALDFRHFGDPRR